MQKRSLLITLLIIVFAFLVFIFKPRDIPIISEAVQKIAAGPKSFLYEARSISKNDQNMMQLQKENDDLKKQLVDYERLKRDNLALRDQFETYETRELRLLPARVIGLSGIFPSHTEVIMDQGEKSGIQKGMAVIFKNNLIGRVEAVSSNFSRAILLQNKKFSTLATTPDTGALGVVRGEGDFILLDQVSVIEEVKPGSLVTTRGQINGQGIGIPPDFIIGKVASVNKNEILPSQSAKVEIDIDVAQLNIVFIVLPF